MSDERKATDILLSIESDVKQILSFLQTLDLNSKIQTERSRILLEKFEGSLVAAPPTTAFRPSVSTTAAPPQSAPQTKSPFIQTPDIRNRIQQAMKEASLDEKNEILVEKPPSDPKRGQKKSPIKQVVVQQKVVYENDGKNVYMGSVEIFNESNTLVKQTKTTQTGKWMAPLPPGIYTVKINKSGTPLKSAVNASYEINVADSEANLELEIKKV